MRNKRYVVNNTRDLYTKHSKNSKNTNNSLKTNLRSVHKNTKTSKMAKSKQHSVLYGGSATSGKSLINVRDPKYKVFIIKNDNDMEKFSNLHYTVLSVTEELYIDNYYSLTEIPENFGGLTTLIGSITSLKKLVIHNCYGLKSLPDSFGNLTALTELDIRNCTSLTSLPVNFGNLTALKTLVIIDCRGLKSLPDSFGNLTSLKKLVIHDCDFLERLPDSFGNLTALKICKIHDCDFLERLPDSFGNLTALTELSIDTCVSLTELPESFGGLQALIYLAIYGCTNLISLPVSFGNLKKLEILEINGCDNLNSLPDTIGLCFKLQKIYIIRVDLLPPSVILVMPYIKVNDNTPEKMESLHKNWFDKIMSSKNPFYTTNIEKLIMWNRTNHDMLSNQTKHTIAAAALGLQRMTNANVLPIVDPELIEESFTHFILKHFPNSITYKFLFNNRFTSIQKIALECNIVDKFIKLINTNGTKLINPETGLVIEEGAVGVNEVN